MVECIKQFFVDLYNAVVCAAYYIKYNKRMPDKKTLMDYLEESVGLCKILEEDLDPEQKDRLEELKIMFNPEDYCPYEGQSLIIYNSLCRMLHGKESEKQEEDPFWD